MAEDWRKAVRGAIRHSAAALLADKDMTAALDGALVRLRTYADGLGLEGWAVLTRRGAGTAVEVEFVDPGRNRLITFGMALPRAGQGVAATENYFVELLEGMAMSVRRRIDAEPDGGGD